MVSQAGAPWRPLAQALTPSPGGVARPAAVRAKRGMSPVAIVLIVIGGLFVLGLIGGTVLLGVGRSAAKPHARSAACRSNLKQIAVAMILYSVDYNGLAPDASTWQTDLQPYIRSTLLCNCPSGGRYEMNPALSRANLLQIANPSQTPLVYDAGFPNGKPPHPEGWNVAFADGHAKAISEAGASQYRSP